MVSTRLYLAACVGSHSYEDVCHHSTVVMMALKRGFTSVEASRSWLLFRHYLSQLGDSRVLCDAAECHASSHGFRL